VLQTGRGGEESFVCGDIVLCMSQMNLKVRGYHRVLKLARTISNMAGSEMIQTSYVAKALQYRTKGMINKSTLEIKLIFTFLQSGNYRAIHLFSRHDQ
jgi:hypothetical protein